MLILFTVIATLTFHTNFAAQGQLLMFLKNLAIIGGLVSVMVSGAGPWSLDEMGRSTKHGRS